nr:MAG TPA: hypothetical protein [Microviridae sp.]
MLRYHLQLHVNMSVALILSRGIEPALTAVGQFYSFLLV